MSAKDDSLYLGHMLDASREVRGLMQGVTRPQFDQDKKLRWALVHLFQTIGEAARRVSSGTQSSMTDIPWRKIIGMRHHLVHDYFFIDYDVIWSTATQELDQLINKLQKLVPPSGPTS